ncbi:hypothetical protein TRFO_41293 [Tritrichomonas foetus]|uniref:Uncharacterized protein n=1 Tax=Tritrichomonas foetus TaxID=1144522 RepID=A0A1J4L0Q8_9EUKA|nr:hypothetical protein TRFO_41293 [Tritrichomonas foetus]|eukprot:OHT17095.1 hypothetical protein TRFO_41293 [Tritrichomonas foetus]
MDQFSNYRGYFIRLSFNGFDLTLNGWRTISETIITSRAFKTLEILDFINIEAPLTDDEVSHDIVKIMKRIRFLHRVSFSGFNPQHVIGFGSFASNQLTREIYLQKQDMTQPIPDTLRLIPQVNHLNFSGASFSLNSLQSLFEMLSHIAPKTSVSLDLSYIDLPESQWGEFFSSLATFPKVKCLRELNWSGNPIEGYAIEQFAHYFFGTNKILFLRIDNIFGSQRLDELRQLFQIIGPNRLWGISINGDMERNFGGNIRSLIEAIEMLGGLSILHINGQHMTDIEIPALTDYLRTHTSIVEIAVDDTSISDQNQFFDFYDNLVNLPISLIKRPNLDLERLLTPQLYNLQDRSRYEAFRGQLHGKTDAASDSCRSFYLNRIADPTHPFDANKYNTFVSRFPNHYFNSEDDDLFMLAPKVAGRGPHPSLNALLVKPPYYTIAELQSKLMYPPTLIPRYQCPPTFVYPPCFRKGEANYTFGTTMDLQPIIRPDGVKTELVLAEMLEGNEILDTPSFQPPQNFGSNFMGHNDQGMENQFGEQQFGQNEYENEEVMGAADFMTDIQFGEQQFGQFGFGEQQFVTTFTIDSPDTSFIPPPPPDDMYDNQNFIPPPDVTPLEPMGEMPPPDMGGFGGLAPLEPMDEVPPPFQDQGFDGGLAPLEPMDEIPPPDMDAYGGLAPLEPMGEIPPPDMGAYGGLAPLEPMAEIPPPDMDAYGGLAPLEPMAEIPPPGMDAYGGLAPLEPMAEIPPPDMDAYGGLAPLEPMAEIPPPEVGAYGGLAPLEPMAEIPPPEVGAYGGLAPLEPMAEIPPPEVGAYGGLAPLEPMAEIPPPGMDAYGGLAPLEPMGEIPPPDMGAYGGLAPLEPMAEIPPPDMDAYGGLAPLEPMAEIPPPGMDAYGGLAPLEPMAEIPPPDMDAYGGLAPLEPMAEIPPPEVGAYGGLAPLQPVGEIPPPVDQFSQQTYIQQTYHQETQIQQTVIQQTYVQQTYQTTDLTAQQYQSLDDAQQYQSLEPELPVVASVTSQPAQLEVTNIKPLLSSTIKPRNKDQKPGMQELPSLFAAPAADSGLNIPPPSSQQPLFPAPVNGIPTGVFNIPSPASGGVPQPAMPVIGVPPPAAGGVPQPAMPVIGVPPPAAGGIPQPAMPVIGVPPPAAGGIPQPAMPVIGVPPPAAGGIPQPAMPVIGTPSVSTTPPPSVNIPPPQ